MIGATCPTIQNRHACLISIENRGAPWAGQPCVWCITEGTCDSKNVCEAISAVVGNPGIDFETCLEPGKDPIYCEPSTLNRITSVV